MLLLSVILLTSCKETPSGSDSVSAFTELEVINNSGNVDVWFVYYVGVSGKSLYTHQIGKEIRHGNSGSFSFKKDDVGGDLTAIDVVVMLQYHDESTQKQSVSTTLDFTLGQSRVVRVDCVSFIKENCRHDGLVLTSVD